MPNVTEGDTGKVASPAESQWYGTDEGEYLVANTLAPIEALVSIPPYTVSTVGPIWLPNDIMEHHLQ